MQMSRGSTSVVARLKYDAQMDDYASVSTGWLILGVMRITMVRRHIVEKA